MGFKQEIGKSRVIDIITSKNKGYFYDMPVTRHTFSDYTTFTKTSMVFNISNIKIAE
ncbi:MAG: hypothetical protein ACI4S3_10640 [Candidatus Gastranaerophilaceae bacterium]